MHIPRQIKILGRTWKVKMQRDLLSMDGVPAMGLCEFGTKTIYVDPDMNDIELVETFIHEWIHAVWHETGIYEEEVPEWVEHMIITAISKEIAYNHELWVKLLG